MVDIRKKKKRTRDGLMDAALSLMGDTRSYTSLSLREVARAAGVVPAAFYRHFNDMDNMGLELVETAACTLRESFQSVRAAPESAQSLIKQSVTIYVGFVRNHKPLFRFLARERNGGNGAIRKAITQAMHSSAQELAIDLGRFPGLNQWSTQDILMLANMLVSVVIHMTSDILDCGDSEDEVQQVIDRACKQMRLLFLGAMHWQSDGEALSMPMAPVKS